MAIVSYGYVGAGRDGEISGSESRLRRQMRIIVNSKTDNEATIISAGILPAYLSPLPDNIFYTCRRIRIHNDQPWAGWMADIEYSTEAVSHDEKERQVVNPLDRRAKISWGSREYTQPIDRDNSGRAILNSAGDYYDPPPERYEAHWVAHVVKNMPSVPTWLLSYQDTVNESPFMVDGITVEAGAAKLSGLSISERREENNYSFRTVEFDLEFRPKPTIPSGNVLDPENSTPADFDGWDLILLDQGLREIVTEDDNGNPIEGGPFVVNMVDDYKETLTAPAPLDGNGHKLESPSPSTVLYFRYRIYERRDFSILPLT